MLDADLAAAFDRIDHSHLLDQLGTFPARGLIERLVEGRGGRERSVRSDRGGNPQGGVISPVLLNVALHGMEEAAGVRYQRIRSVRPAVRWRAPRWWSDTQTTWWHCVSVVNRPKRSRHDWRTWLAPRGLAFNEDKTRVVHLDDGFDFLGFNVRRYQGKLLIKPSKAAVQTASGNGSPPRCWPCEGPTPRR